MALVLLRFANVLSCFLLFISLIINTDFVVETPNLYIIHITFITIICYFVLVRPAFTVIPRSPTYGTVDGDVTFSYKVIGKPKPVITWMHDGTELSADQSYLIQGDGFLKATGLIKNDAGMYQMFARNEAGETQASVELIIRDVGKGMCIFIFYIFNFAFFNFLILIFLILILKF